MANGETIPVEVAYARPDEQVVLAVEVPRGATVRQAIERSGVLQQFMEIDLAENKVGIFGKLTKLEQELQPNDRVEIYRPLIADPKEVRRARAAAGKTTRKGAGGQNGEGEGG